MVISPILSVPTLDKVHLKTHDYTLKVSNRFRGVQSIDEQGIITGEKLFYNSPTINVTVETDRQGQECLKVFFNPNKIHQEQVLKECISVGIDFPILESKVIRTDIERHQQLSQSLIGYHSIFNQSATGRTLRTTNNQSFRIGTASVQLEIYDKSVQANLEHENIVRIETRYLKPNYLQKQGITTFESLLNADIIKLMNLYIRPKEMYFGNLEKLQGNKGIEQVGNYINILERLHQVSSRPITAFMNQGYLMELGIDKVLDIIKCADIPKQKRYNAKKQVLKVASEMIVPQRADMVREIMSYFNLAS